MSWLPASWRVNNTAKVVDFCRRNLAWVLLILIRIAFTFTSPNFLSVTNLLNIFN